MNEYVNLDEVAEAYLSSRTVDRIEYERLLIRAREKAVFPLLRALLIQAIKQKKAFGRMGQELGMTTSDSGMAEYLYAKSTFEPEVEKACSVFQRLGEAAKAELCRALLEGGNKMSLIAALILSTDEYPSSAIENGVNQALQFIRTDQNREIVSMLLAVVLARVGDAKWRDIIESHARNEGISFEEWIERTRNTAMIELQQGE
jgi:hypothetical protein